VTPIFTLVLLGLLSAPPAPSAAPVPTIPPATPAPALSTAPTASAPGAAAATATASAAPTPLATLAPASYGYRFVPRQPANPAPGAPQIFAVYLNAQHLKSHGPILIRVETSDSVVKVESKSNGRGGAIPMVAPGVFFAQSKLPAIPFIASGISTDLVFIGTSADGRKVVVHVPVELG
jgi:hypothetical protein